MSASRIPVSDLRRIIDQTGVSRAVPKSITPARIRENADVLGFALSDSEMEAMTGLDRDLRTGIDPDIVA